MPLNKSAITLACSSALTLSTGAVAAAAALYVGTPVRFDRVPANATATDQDPTFTQDGKTLYFTRAPSSQVHVILVTRPADGKWSAPRMASFSVLIRPRRRHRSTT